VLEFESQAVEVQDFRQIADRFKRILWNIPHIDREKPKDIICSRLKFGNTLISTENLPTSVDHEPLSVACHVGLQALAGNYNTQVY
jgi:hypothetical protein